MKDLTLATPGSITTNSGLQHCPSSVGVSKAPVLRLNACHQVLNRGKSGMSRYIERLFRYLAMEADCRLTSARTIPQLTVSLTSFRHGFVKKLDRPPHHWSTTLTRHSRPWKSRKQCEYKHGRLWRRHRSQYHRICLGKVSKIEVEDFVLS